VLDQRFWRQTLVVLLPLLVLAGIAAFLYAVGVEGRRRP
jgi:hypothetical protein